TDPSCTSRAASGHASGHASGPSDAARTTGSVRRDRSRAFGRGGLRSRLLRGRPREAGAEPLPRPPEGGLRPRAGRDVPLRDDDVRGGPRPRRALERRRPHAPREITVFEVNDQTAVARLVALWGIDY